MSDAGVKILAAVLGFWLIMRAVNKDATGRTLIDHILGQTGGANQALPATTAGAAPGAAAGTAPTGAAGAVDPIPGATGGRLDQGIDVTGRKFLAPYTGTVVESLQSDPGWAGGGYVAVANAGNPKQVEFFAEGLYPTVRKGQRVTAGQPIAVPARNPYNFIFGNIETGPANPANPRQPLAQVISNPAQAVTNFYNWLRGLGGPAATSTANAGHP